MWYAKDKKQVKYNQLYEPKKFGAGTGYTWIELVDGSRRKMTKEERKELAAKRSSEVNKGNTNSSKINHLMTDTLKRRLVQDEAKRANKVIEALLTKAEDGDVHAIKEVLDRSDGKVMQESKISGDLDQPLMIQVVTGIDDND